VNRRALLIGFDPARVPGLDPAESTWAFARARDRAAEERVDLVECLVAPDESAVAEIEAALVGSSWDAVVIGGGVRKPDAAVPFLEVVANLVARRAPLAAIAFNTSPADTVEAALRAVDTMRSLGVPAPPSTSGGRSAHTGAL
jgi:hypothetical protein